MFSFRGQDETQDNVVFFYPDYLYLFWYRNRVWQVRCDRRFATTVFGVAMGMPREVIERTSSASSRPREIRCFFDLEDAKYADSRAACLFRTTRCRTSTCTGAISEPAVRDLPLPHRRTLEEDLASSSKYRTHVDLLELGLISFGPRRLPGRRAAAEGGPAGHPYRARKEGGRHGENGSECSSCHESGPSGFAFVDLEEDLQAPEAGQARP